MNHFLNDKSICKKSERERFLNEDEKYDTKLDPNVLHQKYKKRSHQIKYDTYEYKRIIHETDKSWLLEMSGGARRWLPKSKCHITGDIVYVPSWLVSKILFSDAIKNQELNIKKEQME
jgi:hypothetical protein